MSKRYLNEGDHVLLIDDFLANGKALKGLIELCHEAGATVEGIGIAVEKGFKAVATSCVRKGTTSIPWQSSNRWIRKTRHHRIPLLIFQYALKRLLRGCQQLGRRRTQKTEKKT